MYSLTPSSTKFSLSSQVSSTASTSVRRLSLAFGSGCCASDVVLVRHRPRFSDLGLAVPGRVVEPVLSAVEACSGSKSHHHSRLPLACREGHTRSGRHRRRVG